MKVEFIPIDELKPAPFNPVARVTDRALEDLIKSMQKDGFWPHSPNVITRDNFIADGHRRWTTAKILDAAANVTQEHFLAPASFPHGGLRGTLVHAMFAEWIWRNRWEGTSPNTRFKPDDFPTFESMRTRWMEEEARLMAFVESLTDEQLNGKFTYKDTKGNPYDQILWKAMAHVVNHGTQHMTEAAAMLTEFGHSPGDIDLIYFLIEKE